MRLGRTGLLVFLLGAPFLVVLRCSAQDVNANEDDALVQKNPEFVEPLKEASTESKGSGAGDSGDGDEIDGESGKNDSNASGDDGGEGEDDDADDDDEGEDEDDESDYEDDEEEEDAIKSAIANALADSRKFPRLALKFVTKNRLKLTIAATLFAFRKEFRQLAVHLLTTPASVDKETGKVLSRRVNIHPTAVLKMVLFLDLMRKLQSGDPSESPGRLGGSFLYKLLHPANSAYIPPIEQHWTFERMNERYAKDEMALQKALSPGSSLKVNIPDMRASLEGLLKLTENGMPSAGNESDSELPDTAIILDWTNLKESLADRMGDLRDQVSFLLSQHRSKNQTLQTFIVTNTTGVNSTFVSAIPITEVIVILESPGGAAADYGLAAQMILRLCHEPGMLVTVCVDKVAASGGYMIGCASSTGRLYAAPFAVLGSIGVIGSTINVHDMLLGWGVKPLVFKGGKDKAPVGLIGEVTKQGMAKVQSMVDATHVAFKRHVVAARPALKENIDEIATGNVWLGYEALDAGLVDRIITSDEYIGERILDGARVLRMIKHHKPRFLLPHAPPRLSVSQVMAGIRTSLRSLVTDLAELSTGTPQDDVQLTPPGYGIAAAASSIGVSRTASQSNP